MYCAKCGKQIVEDARFCPYCGAAVVVASNSSTRRDDVTIVKAPKISPGVTAPMPRIASVDEATRPKTVTAAVPASASGQARRKSKTPLVVLGTVAAIALVGGATVFALGGHGSGDASQTPAAQSVDAGSADGSNNDVDTLMPEEKDPVGSDTDFADADPQAGTASEDAPLTQVHTYSNARFGFSASIPDRFKVSQVPADNDGLGYTDPTTGVSITVSGAGNMGRTAQQLLDGLDLSDMQDVYTAAEDGWYVASWRDGNAIVYERVLVLSDKMCAMRFDYPVSQRDTGSSLVESLAETLAFN